jgi:hypothetical protein
VSVRVHNGRWVVEVYDQESKKKRQLNLREIRALGHEPRRNEREAKRIERAALNARDRRRPGARDETCGSFATRWPDDYRLGRGGERAWSTSNTRRAYGGNVRALRGTATAGAAAEAGKLGGRG